MKNQAIQNPITSLPINLVGLSVTLGVLYAIIAYGGKLTALQSEIICLLALFIPIALLESLVLKTYRYPSAGLDFGRRNKDWFSRCLFKLIGFYTTLSVIAFIYWLIPEYSGTFYNRYYEFLWLVVPYILILAPIYIICVDRAMKMPNDSMWMFGQLVCAKYDSSNKEALTQYALGWVVKAFFLPLMYTYFSDNLSVLRASNFEDITNSFKGFFDFSYVFLFYIDLLFVVVGYLATLRICDSHIRSTDPSMLGWAVAISCYQPFWSFWSNYYIQYDDGMGWGYWFSNNPFLYSFWGSLIILSILVYVWASVTFGLRFSNLTNRGILTNGPYRYTKHPAYLSKNISWWMISLPFLSIAGWEDALRHSLMLAMLNGVYYLRAKTEERHLSNDQCYRDYINHIQENGILAKCRKTLSRIRLPS